MINIIKIKKDKQKEKKPKGISLRPIHNELALISDKFIGITSSDGKIVDIVVEDNISDSKLAELQSKFEELTND